MFSFIFLSQITLGQERFALEWEEKSQKVKSNWLLFPNQKEAQSFLDSILFQQRKSGYLASFWEVSIQRDSARAVLVPGPRLDKVQVAYGNLPESFRKDLPGLPSDFFDLANWMQGALIKAENEGFPFASIYLDSLKRKKEELYAVLNFDAGPQILWDSVEVQGETKTQSRYIQHLTGIIPGEVFSQKQLKDAGTLLRQSPYFRLTAAPSLSFQQRKAKPIFSLRDRNSNVFDGIIGILPNENEPGKVLLTGQIDVELYHLGGKGRDIAVHWQRLNLQTQSLDLSAKESFLFNSPMSVRVGFSLLKQDTTFLNRFLSLDFGYQFSPEVSLRFFTKRQAGDLLSTTGLAEITELPEAADFRWNEYGLGMEWKKLDNPIFPRRGVLGNAQFSAGNKRILENTGIPELVYQQLTLNTPQYAIMGSLEKHFFFKPTWGMWLKGSFAWIENENLLLNDLYRLGGLKSIRGFNENFFYARSFGYLSMEQRLFFGGSSFLMVFVDAGLLENPFAVETTDQPVSFGTGINLDTNGGIFRFILGVGKSNEQPLSFSYSRIHFGYIARF